MPHLFEVEEKRKQEYELRERDCFNRKPPKLNDKP